MLDERGSLSTTLMKLGCSLTLLVWVGIPVLLVVIAAGFAFYESAPGAVLFIGFLMAVAVMGFVVTRHQAVQCPACGMRILGTSKTDKTVGYHNNSAGLTCAGSGKPPKVR